MHMSHHVRYRTPIVNQVGYALHGGIDVGEEGFVASAQCDVHSPILR